MIIGIDPGLSGALALIGPEGQFVDVWDMPVMDKPNSNKSYIKRCIDPLKVYVMLKEWCLHSRRHKGIENIEVCMENVASQPRDGVAGAFSFGESFGTLKAVCSCLGLLPINYVTPATWKKYFNIGADKEEARLLALEKMPEAGPMLARKKDHDRAEALLIALYYHLNKGTK